MRASTKKLTTAAVCTALAILLCVCTAYLPLSVMPLYLAAFCIYLACRRGSAAYGVLCAVASVGLMFLMTGLSVKWFVFLFMFAPYGIIASFIYKFDYTKVKSGIIRAVAVILYFNLTFGLVYLVATRVVGIGLDVPVTDWAVRLGGYYVLAIVATVVLVPLDLVFTALSVVVLKHIPVLREKKKRVAPETDTEVAADGKRYDIFGYEIIDRSEQMSDKSEGAEKPQDGGKSNGGE